MNRLAIWPFLLLASICCDQRNRGYYRFPASSGSNIVFTAEGDL